MRIADCGFYDFDCRIAIFRVPLFPGFATPIGFASSSVCFQQRTEISASTLVLHGHHKPGRLERKNENRSGSVPIRMITKAVGRYCAQKIHVSFADPDQIEHRCLQADYKPPPGDPKQVVIFSLQHES
ncbi:MAG: hypothetical protein IH582_09240 [Afipia sp.]|nr:hypothetical protein [Afipia sp.]